MAGSCQFFPLVPFSARYDDARRLERLACPALCFLTHPHTHTPPSAADDHHIHPLECWTDAKMGFEDVLKKQKDRMSRLGIAIQTSINPNHRHDEKWEQEEDKIREEICESHRFRSFANVRNNNAVKWYSDGHDYFWALSEMLDNAKECIFVSFVERVLVYCIV